MLPAHDYAPAPETPAAIHAAYLVHLQRRDRGNTAYTQAARSFLRRWPRVQAWADVPLEWQLAANSSTRPFVTFLMISRPLRPGYDYLVCRKLCSLWHELTDSCLQPDLDRFMSAAVELGFTQRVASAIGSQIIARLLIQTGRPLADLRESDLQELLHACDVRQTRTGRGARHYRSTTHSARQILFHLGVLDDQRPPAVTALSLEQRMADVPTALRPAFVAYLNRKHATCAPKTVSSLATRLAHFGRYLAAADPTLTSLSQLDRRRHIEPFITSLTTTANSVTGEPITVADRIRRVHAVGNFLAEITEWGWDDAPPRRLIFRTDLPRPQRFCPDTYPSTRTANSLRRYRNRPTDSQLTLCWCNAHVGCASANYSTSNSTASTRSPGKDPGSRSRSASSTPNAWSRSTRKSSLSSTASPRPAHPVDPWSIPAPERQPISCSPITENDSRRTQYGKS
jgi:hypothetical protein